VLQAAHRAALAAGMGTRQSAFAAARAVPRAVPVVPFGDFKA